MTTIAGTPEYAREYQRRRAHGLPTVGLAAEMRAGTTVPTIPPKKLRLAQQMYARGLRTSDVMDALGLTYAQCQTVRAGMAG
jgi:hypothetical protein